MSITTQDLDAMDQEEFDLLVENMDQLDEISGELLGRYIQKARADTKTKSQHAKDLDDHPKVTPLKAKLSALRASKSYNKWGSGEHQKAVNSAEQKITDTKKKIDPSYPKSTHAGKRQQGVVRAFDKLKHGKLTNEDLDAMNQEEFDLLIENIDQLDEISGELLGRYIQKARADSATKSQHAKDLDAHPKVTPLKAKLSAYYDERRYTKDGHSVHRKAIDSTQQKIIDTKKKIDPSYPKSVLSGKHQRGVDTAIGKLRSGKLTNEDLDAMDQEEFDLLIENIDQLDELSKTTLGSYIKKAAKNTNKYWPRHDGIRTAVGKLTKESVLELIDAIDSGSTLNITESFNEIMASKLVDAIEYKREEIAGNLFTVSEAEDTVTKDNKGNVVKWKHVGDWKKSKKDPAGKVAHMSDRERRKAEELANARRADVEGDADDENDRARVKSK